MIRMTKRDLEILEELAKIGGYGGRWHSKSAVVRTLIRREFAAREEKKDPERS